MRKVHYSETIFEIIKVHYSEIEPFTFGREVAEAIIDMANYPARGGSNKYNLQIYTTGYAAFWDHVWKACNMAAVTEADIESGEYLRWQEEAESAMRTCLNE